MPCLHLLRRLHRPDSVFKLFAPRVEQARQACQRRGQDADRHLQRADDHAEYSTAQQVVRRQSGQLLDFSGVDALVAQQGGLQQERAIDARVVLQRFGRRDRVGAEGDRRRADEVGDDAVRPVRSAAKRASVFLATTYSTPSRSQAPAQVLQLGNAQAAVLGEHGDLGVAELLGKLVDGRIFVGSGADCGSWP